MTEHDNYRGGNLYNKYGSKNPLVKILMDKFLKDFDNCLDSIDAICINVLDVGCGEGYLTAHIKEHNRYIDIEGIDYYDHIIEIAKGLHRDIKFLQGSIYELPYENNKFDILISSEVLEHLDNPERAINEIKRVSKKYCIITVPNEPYFRIANVCRFKYISSFGNTPGHIQNWTKKDFKELLEKHFKKVSIKTSTLWQIALCEI